MIKIKALVSKLSIATKLALMFSFLGIASVLLASSWIISDFSKTVYEKERTIEAEAFNKLSQFSSDTYQNIYNLLVVINSEENISGSLNRFNVSENQADKNSSTRVLIGQMENIAISNNILDFIVVSDKGSVFHTTKVGNRVVNHEYDFDSKPPLNSIVENPMIVSMYYDEEVAYIKATNELEVVSFIGNIIKMELVPEIHNVGKYIINIPASAFTNAYKMAVGTNQLKSHFFLISQDDEIIYYSSSELVNRLEEDEKEKLFLPNNGPFEDDKFYYRYDKVSRTKMRLVSLIDKSVFDDQIKEQKLKVYTVVILTILIYIGVAIVLSKVISKKIDVLLVSMNQVMDGNLKVEIPIKTQDEIGNVYLMFNDMCTMLNDNINRIYVSELKQKKAELLALQSQINPHYLYNTLESIRSRAVVDQNYELERMVYLLGEIFRWNSKTDTYVVKIEDEIENISKYLELQSLRFDQPMHIEVEIDPKIYNAGIPKMLLQPLVENSILHGIYGQEESATITICGYKNEDQVIIEIKDDGIGMNARRYEEVIRQLDGTHEEDVADSIGISNVNGRIRLLFGDDYGLTIESEENRGGTKIRICIPQMKREDMIQYVRGGTYS